MYDSDILQREIDRNINFSVARINISINNIRTKFFTKQVQSKYRFYFNERQKGEIVTTEVEFHDIFISNALVGLERDDIAYVEYSTAYGVLNIVTTDFKFMEEFIKTGRQPASIAGLHSDKFYIVNKHGISDDQLEVMYITHMLTVFSSFSQVASKNRQYSLVFRSLREFYPLIPVKEKYVEFFRKYDVLLPFSVMKLIDKIIENKAVDNKYYWCTPLDIAETYGLGNKRIDVVMLLTCIRAHFMNDTVYVLVKEVPGMIFPRELSEGQYIDLVQAEESMTEHYSPMIYSSILLNELNKYAEFVGCSSITDDVKEKLGL